MPNAAYHGVRCAQKKMNAGNPVPANRLLWGIRFRGPEVAANVSYQGRFLCGAAIFRGTWLRCILISRGP